jgi:hypothetical protein
MTDRPRPSSKYKCWKQFVLTADALRDEMSLIPPSSSHQICCSQQSDHAKLERLLAELPNPQPDQLPKLPSILLIQHIAHFIRDSVPQEAFWDLILQSSFFHWINQDFVLYQHSSGFLASAIEVFIKASDTAPGPIRERLSTTDLYRSLCTFYLDPDNFSLPDGAFRLCLLFSFLNRKFAAALQFAVSMPSLPNKLSLRLYDVCNNHFI